MPPLIRVFVSSPGDVATERLAAADVLERLQAELLGRAVIEPVLWEQEPMRAAASFQDQIPDPAAADVFVCVLWSRLGTRLPDGALGAGQTGTEYEFERAVEAFRASKRPEILVYRKAVPPAVPLTTEEEVTLRLRERRELDAFFDERFGNPRDGFRLAFKQFDSGRAFSDLLYGDLRRLVLERVSASAVTSEERAPPLGGNPFRGLQHFDFEHADRFFGREEAVAKAEAKLTRQAAAGRAFLLVLGMSGCGKSSLVRAGLLPRISRPGRVEGVGLWRRATLRPGDATTAGGLVKATVAALLAKKALPELSALGATPEELAEALSFAPRQAAVPLLRAALRRAAEAEAAARGWEVPPEARLALFVDQLEELFTAEGISDSDRLKFGETLDALAGSGLVWVVTAMRSDFYHRLADVPGLAALKEGEGQIDLLPPTASEAERMIRMPSRAAGLAYELDSETGQSLDRVLIEAAAKDGRSLPLLEFTLERLYVERRQDVLTFDAYHRLGGLEGALASEAERILAEVAEREGLDERDTDDVLGGLLETLAMVDPAGEAVVARRAPLVEAEIDPARAKLVRALVEGRLLVTDRDAASAAPVVAVAHEALLRSWPRAAAWAERNRDLLRVRGRVTDAAARWRAEKEVADLLLPAGRPLVEAEDLLAKRRVHLPVDLIRFIETSARIARRRRRIALTIAAGVIVALSGLSALSFAQMRRAESEAITAKRERKRADDNSTTADAERRAAVSAKKQALALGQKASKAEQQAKERAHDLAVRLAEAKLEEALTDDAAGKAAVASGAFRMAARLAAEAGDTELARASLRVMADRLMQGGRALAVPMRHSRDVGEAVVNPAGDRIATGEIGFNFYDRNVQLWDAMTGEPVGERLHGFSSLPNIVDDAIVFSPDGSRLLTCNGHGAWLWDGRTGVPIPGAIPGEDLAWHFAGELRTKRFSRDGRRLLLVGEKEWRLLDTASGSLLIPPVAIPEQCIVLADEPLSRVIAFHVDGLVRFWNAADGTEFDTARGFESDVAWHRFSPDGSRLLTKGAADVRLWNTVAAAAIGVWPWPTELDGRADELLDHLFSPDGSLLVLPVAADAVRVFSATTGESVGGTLRHAGHIKEVRINAEGSRLALLHEVVIPPPAVLPPDLPTGHPFDGGWSVEQDFLTVWDLRTGELGGPAVGPANVGVPDDFPLSLVAFNQDGSRLLTYAGGTAHLRDGGTGALLAELPLAASGVRFCAGGGTVYGGENGTRLWDATTGDLLAEPVRPTDGKRTYAISDDGTLIAGTAEDGTTQVWDMARGEPVGDPLRHEGPLRSVAFTPDATRLITIGEDRTVRLRLVRTPSASVAVVNDVMALDCNAAGTRVLTERHVEVDGELKTTTQAWDGRDGRLVSEWEATGEPRSVRISPDGRLAASSIAQDVYLWDVNDGKLVGRPLHHDAPVVEVAFSGDGRMLATGTHFEPERPDDFEASEPLDDSCSITLWDTSTCLPLAGPVEHGPALDQLVFSPDGRRIASAGREGTPLRVWDVPNLSPIGTPLLEPGLDFYEYSRFRAFSPKDSRILALRGDRGISLWDVNTASILCTLPTSGPNSVAANFAFSPDGLRAVVCDRLVSGDRGGTARVWEVPSGIPVGRAMRFPGDAGVRDVTFSADGRTIVTTGSDQAARLWDARTGAALSGPVQHDFRPDVSWVREFRAQLLPSGSRLVSSGADGIRVTDMALPIPSATETWAEVASGVTVDNAGTTEVIDLEDDSWRYAWHEKWAALRRQDAEWLGAVRDRTEWLVADEQRFRTEQAEGRGDHSAAAFHLTRLVRKEPTDRSLRIRLATAYVNLTRWQDASAEWAAADRLEPLDFDTLDGYALAALAAGDAAGHLKAAERLREAAERGSDPVKWDSAAWTAILNPRSSETAQRWIALAKRAVQANPASAAYAETLGTALYRAGLYEEALKQLEAAANLKAAADRKAEEESRAADEPSVVTELFPADTKPAGGPTAWTRLVLAMTSHRLGRTENAHRFLSEAVGQVEAMEEGSLTNLWLKLRHRLLRAEAERLIRPTSVPVEAPHP